MASATTGGVLDALFVGVFRWGVAGAAVATGLSQCVGGVLAEFDRIIGLDRLYALHLNDSKNPMGSHKDRHEKIGQGSLGAATFRNIVTHPLLQGKPMILETPNELPGYQQEIALLRSFTEK